MLIHIFCDNLSHPWIQNSDTHENQIVERTFPWCHPNLINFLTTWTIMFDSILVYVIVEFIFRCQYLYFLQSCSLIISMTPLYTTDNNCIHCLYSQIEFHLFFSWCSLQVAFFKLRKITETTFRNFVHLIYALIHRNFYDMCMSQKSGHWTKLSSNVFISSVVLNPT